jgi:hypothetical protein
MIGAAVSHRDTLQTVVDVAQIATGIGAIAIPTAIATLSYARRPSVSLAEDTERIQSRLEGFNAEWPHVRLLACNKGWRRAAHGTRVIVEGYRKQGAPPSEMVTLGSPLLGWPSAPELPDGGLTVLPGNRRPIDFGSLVPLHRGPDGKLLSSPVASDAEGRTLTRAVPLSAGGRWEFHLGLAFGLVIADYREFLPAGEWVVRLTIGADDSSPRTYDVDVAWRGDEPTGREALDAILSHLAVREVD